MISIVSMENEEAMCWLHLQPDFVLPEKTKEQSCRSFLCVVRNDILIFGD